jgi:DNA-binding response OmpR family regulator
MKILVIDDDELVRRMVTRVLRAAGHDVATAENGLRGMALIRKERPQIVITDIIMPEQEGLETILEIRRDNSEIKVIAMSGSASIGSTDILTMARLLGADEVLHKPFRAEELLSRVHGLGTAPATGEGSTV